MPALRSFRHETWPISGSQIQEDRYRSALRALPKSIRQVALFCDTNATFPGNASFCVIPYAFRRFEKLARRLTSLHLATIHDSTDLLMLMVIHGRTFPDLRHLSVTFTGKYPFASAVEWASDIAFRQVPHLKSLVMWVRGYGHTFSVSFGRNQLGQPTITFPRRDFRPLLGRHPGLQTNGSIAESSSPLVNLSRCFSTLHPGVRIQCDSFHDGLSRISSFQEDYGEPFGIVDPESLRQIRGEHEASVIRAPRH